MPKENGKKKSENWHPLLKKEIQVAYTYVSFICFGKKYCFFFLIFFFWSAQHQYNSFKNKKQGNKQSIKHKQNTKKGFRKWLIEEEQKRIEIEKEKKREEMEIKRLMRMATEEQRKREMQEWKRHEKDHIVFSLLFCFVLYLSLFFFQKKLRFCVLKKS